MVIELEQANKKLEKPLHRCKGDCRFRKKEPIIALLTDFGHDESRALMHSAIMRINPHARRMDLTHGVPAFNILSGAWKLARFVNDPPALEGVIYVGVVDPGVGSARRALIVQDLKGNVFIGPDNGLLSLAFAEHGIGRAVSIDEAKLDLVLKETGRAAENRVSRTFHGRDIFAPAAACISLGFPIEGFGKEVDGGGLKRIAFPGSWNGGPRGGYLADIDSFGCLRTTLPNSEFTHLAGRRGKVTIEARETGKTILKEDVLLGEMFAGHANSLLLAVLSSTGSLDLAYNSGNASTNLGIGFERIALDARGAPITAVKLDI